MVEILTLILTLFCLHFYHLTIRKKIERIRETLDELASVQQNAAYGLVARSQQRSALHTSSLYETIPEHPGTVSRQSINHTLRAPDSEATDVEYDYIDNLRFPVHASNLGDFSFEHHQSFAAVTDSHRRGAVRNLQDSSPLYVNVEVTVPSQ